jgi:ZIP family zinc transporter
MFDQFSPLVNVLLLSLVASLGTALGGALAIIRRPGRRAYGFLMGITAGVMICLSFMELVNEAWELGGPAAATLGFGIGALFMLTLDYLAPHLRFGQVEFHGHHTEDLARADDAHDNPDITQTRRRHRRGAHWLSHGGAAVDAKLINSGLLLAIGISLHNLPEGISVGAGYMHNPQFGLFIAMAIMLHNIPEGLATALPLSKGGAKRGYALGIAVLSGLAEPLGAVLASLFLGSFQNLIPGALAFAGGVMVYITLDELIPSAREYGSVHWTSLGIIVGSIFVFLLSAWMGV